MNVALCPGTASLDIISLCTGGGGLDLGFELAIPGARSVCLVEREAFAVAHLVSAMRAGLIHEAPVWSNAATFDGRAWRGCVDGVIGGIPCQPHSLAGKRLGEDDERDLWSTARRIIVQARAWFVLIENVRGMLSSGGAERVWRDLSRLGFASEGGLFTAAEVCASHERERIFILAVADARNPGSQGHEWAAASAERHRQAAPRPVAELRRASLDDTVSGRRHARRDDNGKHVRNEPIATSEFTLGDAPSARLHAPAFAGTDCRDESGGPRDAQSQRRSNNVGDASIARGRPIPIQPGRQDKAGGDADRPGLFPPGPSDAGAWRDIIEHAPDLLPALSGHDRFLAAIRKARALADGDPGARQGLDPNGSYGLHPALVQALAQSTLRRVADGVVSRVDELRMLGNGVVPLEAAYAIRTLATRLAARGSAGATRLVRMMEAAE